MKEENDTPIFGKNAGSGQSIDGVSAQPTGAVQAAQAAQSAHAAQAGVQAAQAGAQAVDIVEQVENPDGSVTTRVDEVVVAADGTPVAENIPPVGGEAAGGVVAGGTAVGDVTNGVAGMPGVQNTPIGSAPGSVAAPKKKKKTGLIVGCVIGGVAVIGGGVAGAIAFNSYYNSPETIATDAITNLFKSEPMMTNTVTEVDLGSMGAYMGVDSVKIEANESTNGDGEGSGTITASVKADAGDFSMKVGNAVSKDGVIYLKLDGVSDLYDKYSANLPYATARVLSGFENIISEADGQWYKIDIPELVDKYYSAFGLSKSDAKTIKGLYKCLFNTFSSMPDYLRDLGEVYREYPFASMVEYTGSSSPKHGGKLYNVKLDAGKLMDFMKKAVDTKAADDIAACMDDAGISASTVSSYTNINGKSSKKSSSKTFKEVLSESRESLKESIDNAKEDVAKAQESLDEMMEEMPDYYIEIDGSHHIIGMGSEISQSGMKSTMDTEITYGKSEVSIPSDAKSIDSLIDDVIDELNNMSAVDYSDVYAIDTDAIDISEI